MFGERLSFKRFGLKVVLWSCDAPVPWTVLPRSLVPWSRASSVPRFSNFRVRLCFGPWVSLPS